MRNAQILLLSALVAVACVISVELWNLNQALRPLNRIPTASAFPETRSDEPREQRIDRAARRRLQMRDDEAAIDQRVRELVLERQPDATPNPKQSRLQGRR